MINTGSLLEEAITYSFQSLRCLVNNNHIKILIEQLPSSSGMTRGKYDLGKC